MRLLLLSFFIFSTLFFDRGVVQAKISVLRPPHVCNERPLDRSVLSLRTESPFDPDVQERVFRRVRELLGITLNQNIPVPAVVRVEDLSEDEYIKLAGSPPSRAQGRRSGYNQVYNTIFLLDREYTYILAHEYTHYLQRHYIGLIDGSYFDECMAQSVERHFYPEIQTTEAPQ